MSAPVRFLFVAVAGWALFRGATAGMLPGVEAFTIAKAEAAPAPPQSSRPNSRRSRPSQPRCPRDGGRLRRRYGGYPPPAYPVPPRYVPAPVYYYPRVRTGATCDGAASAACNPASRRTGQPARILRADSAARGMGPRAGRARLDVRGRRGRARPVPRPAVLHPAKASRPAAAQHLGVVARSDPGTGSLASGGTLGGSQAGARLTYAFDPPDRRVAAVEHADRRKPRRRSRGRRPPHAFPVDPGLDHRRTAAGDRPVQHRPFGLRSVRGRRRLSAAARLEPAARRLCAGRRRRDPQPRPLRRWRA